MRLAKQCVDIALQTNDPLPMLTFWQSMPGVAFVHDQWLPSGAHQHRHDVRGSVLKINHQDQPLSTSLSGYRELLIASDGVSAPRSLSDPDRNCVSLIPAGHLGVTQVGVRIAVRSLPEHCHFYASVFGLREIRKGVFAAGETLLMLEEDRSASLNAGFHGIGWRYMTFEVFDVRREHEAALAKGGREALAPVLIGDTARISMILDPDGNWVELSQRGSIVGSID